MTYQLLGLEFTHLETDLTPDVRAWWFCRPKLNFEFDGRLYTRCQATASFLSPQRRYWAAGNWADRRMWFTVEDIMAVIFPRDT